jgi:hypothetical protein
LLLSVVVGQLGGGERRMAQIASDARSVRGIEAFWIEALCVNLEAMMIDIINVRGGAVELVEPSSFVRGEQ